MKFFNFKKKLNGYFLFEILLATAISAGLFIMIYRSYDSIIKNVDFLKNNSELNSKKITFSYNLRRDLAELYFPSEIDYIYKIAEKISKKDEKSEGLKSANKSSDEKKEDESSKNEFSKLKEKFSDYSKYFPVLKISDEEIIFKFFSTRLIFENSESRKFSEIEYKFSLRNDFNFSENGKNIKIYSLKRSEKNFSNKKKFDPKEYEILEYVQDPKITLIYSKILEEKNDEKPEKKSKEKEKISLFQKWYEDQIFEKREKFIENSPENFLKTQLIPNFVIFEGFIISENKRKKMPFRFLFSIPVSFYYFEKILNRIQDKKNDSNKEKKDKNKEKDSKENLEKDDKIPDKKED